jgi:predicted SnoaL-like aldol condensation-catalyzing enzyme
MCRLRIRPGRLCPERGSAVLELHRVRDGKIVGHWAAVQDVPENSAKVNTMF